MQLICVDPSRVREFWPHVGSLLRAACYRTKLISFDDLEMEVLEGDGLLWIVWSGSGVEAAVTTSLINTDAGKVCIITACAGSDMKHWLPLIEQIENYAKNEGCYCVRIYGRKGWLHVLDGYKAEHVIMDKELA